VKTRWAVGFELVLQSESSVAVSLLACLNHFYHTVGAVAVVAADPFNDTI
jgi:hypothetical protein